MTDVAENKVVLFKYTLRNSDGIKLESSGDESMPYLHGAENIVPGLESAMDGKSVGDSFEVVVPPEEGYGERHDIPEQEAPREMFQTEGQLAEGMQFFLETPDGNMFPAWITEVEEDTVKFDTNHPLAGEELHFDVEITAVREATDTELDHGHPHGPEGHATH